MGQRAPVSLEGRESVCEALARLWDPLRWLRMGDPMRTGTTSSLPGLRVGALRSSGGPRGTSLQTRGVRGLYHSSVLDHIEHLVRRESRDVAHPCVEAEACTNAVQRGHRGRSLFIGARRLRRRTANHDSTECQWGEPTRTWARISSAISIAEAPFASSPSVSMSSLVAASTAQASS